VTARAIEPLERPPDAEVVLPGSKSITNRAFLAAALADGTSTIGGILVADDTVAMLDAVRALGIEVAVQGTTATVVGCGGVLPATEARIDVRLSGTTARFIAPALALGHGRFELDGAAPFRRRPMGPLLEALTDIGVRVEPRGEPGHLPVELVVDGWHAERISVTGDISSQFLSGLLLAAPAAGHDVLVEVTTSLVSRPYVDLTLDTVRTFGGQIDEPEAGRFHVHPTGYRATTTTVEPDASAATYFLAAAAITGGRVRIPGLTRSARQGDAGFATVLERMGAEVVVDDTGTEVRGTGALRGIEVDLGAMSDTAQTLAAVAVFATGPTRVTGIGFIRAKETDRIAAVVTELQRCGIDAQAEEDGFVVHPGTPQPATVRTYDDHRMAMSFALLGLVTPGIRIADPECVDKTFPDYFQVLDQLRR
jgi:3-phosphoshikimate 1-carboxyvinyltransferase